MIYIVSNKKEFKKANLENWYTNTDFWLQGKMRHLKDIYDFTGDQILFLIKELNKKDDINLVDFGCGEGWVLNLLNERKMNVNYIGLDFNIKFITYLKEKYSYNKNCAFHCIDLEDSPPKSLLELSDIGINCFNFFEIPDIEKAFKNVCIMLKPKSYLLIINIDPILQIFSVSNSEKDFINNLKLYEQYQSKLGYDKDIDIGDFKSNRIYKSLLYSTETYVELGKKNNLVMFGYKEVIKTANFVPQIYQFLFFKKL